MNIAIIVVTFCVLFCSVVGGLQVVEAEAAISRTISVPDDYSSIQVAIDNAQDGDRVVVKSGTYNGSVLVDKAVSLIGENVRIIGDYSLNGTAILVTSGYVTVTGFIVEPSAPSPSRRGIHLLDANHCNIYNNTFLNSKVGIWLYGSSENTIVDNFVFGSGDTWGEIKGHGAKIENSNHNLIQNNIFENNNYGMSIYSSSQNNISANKVKNNFSAGIHVYADQNWLIGNKIEGNTIGLSLHGVNNILRNNMHNNNTVNFEIDWAYSEDTSTFFNDIDDSNTIEGNPIIYWVDSQNRSVPDTAAFVCLVRCVNITVENLFLQGNDAGIILVATTNSSVKNNLISAEDNGILVCESSSNLISKNTIIDCHIGIRLQRPNTNNSISYNTMSDCRIGLWLSGSVENIIKANIISGTVDEGLRFHSSQKNNITENTISNCTDRALMLWENSTDNLFHFNNFIDNTKNVEKQFGVPVNSWDNGTMGNYWSDYNGTDSNSDGVGDTPYIFDTNNKDNYPLMFPITISNSSLNPTPTASLPLTPTPIPSSTQQPTTEHSPTTNGNPTSSYTLIIIIIAIVTIAVVVGLLAYLAKYKG